MKVLKEIQPREVLGFFEEICAIPHGSGNTKAVSDWCADFARQRGLEYHQDGDNNIIIIKPATPGYEEAQPVILQGHLDMVCEKEPGCAKDMATEGLDLAVEGDYIFARGTTLGGDDGIAVAMALAVLDSDRLEHPRIEAVFTVDEEIGLLGAGTLDVSPLQGRRMINIDSEEEGVFTVSCAGGNNTICTLPLVREPFSGAGLRVTVGGLAGGHSGAEIHKGRANANRLLGRLLRAAAKATGLRVDAVQGGLKSNAIPVESTASLAAEDGPAAARAMERLARELENEYSATDPGLFVRVEKAPAASLPMDEVTTGRVICMLTCLPNGVQAMSPRIPGLVQTSLNLGILTCGEKELKAVFGVRSSVDSQKEMLKEQLACLMEQLDGAATYESEYTGWEYQPDSPLRELMVEVYRDQYGKEPRVEAIHAGLECGLFAGKLPGLDCVSMGPNLLDIHTPRERMSISSVQRTWKFLTEVLRRSR